MPDDALSAGAVARRLGVAVTTLRTWHQRYGLGPSRHVPGHHRRYTPDDLARLEIMRRLTTEGVAPAEAARWAQHAPSGAGGATPSRSPSPVLARGASPPAAGSRGASPPAAAARAGGGFTIPVGRAGPVARGLARAAVRLDASTMRDILERAVARIGVVPAWDDVIRPVLTGIGDRHAATKRLVEVEHLFSRTTSEVLAAVPRPRGAPPARILLACADEEQHSLPLEALAAALAEAGISSRLLGARVPPTALAEAVERIGPAVVMLWSHAAATGDAGQVRALLRGAHRPMLVMAGGPGWPVDDLPPDVVTPGSLAEALRLASGGGVSLA